MSLNHNEGTISRTSPTLLQAARENHPAAWKRIVDKYSRRIYRWCRQAGLQPEDASDIVQDVFRAVARKLVDFHHDQAGDTFRGWLYAITRNKLRDHFGRRPGRNELAFGGTDAQKRFMELPIDSHAEESTGIRNNSKLDKSIVQQIQAEFSERDWQVFWRVVVDGQTAKEAGEHFDMTSNAVRLVKMRILRRLRALAGEKKE
ncbi:MAG: sigma-70 family RNA polymerase sigma factor [Planctomycetota bacterium]